MRKPLLAHPGVRHAKRPNCLAAGMLAMALSPALAYAAEPAKADADNKEATKTLAPVKVIGTQGERVQGYKAETTRLGRMKQELKDVPQAVSVVTHDLMAEQGAANLKDVLKNVSGITFAAGEGGRSGDQVILRGFAAFNDMYRDGQRDVAQYNRDPFNDEKIEVLKGASSMLFGRGSTGGVINQVSKAPFAGELLGADLTIGTNHYQRITLDVNKPYSDTTAVRLNVMGTEDGSPNGKSQSKR
ncbi:TonB-dependent receptor, partial [Rivihabitans pingtungensis]|uniref:TonB-dependent receptor n=1 Tax=Rivihabitans pingtungensis TaxID=1054498 RepID=UPI002FDA976E